MSEDFVPYQTDGESMPPEQSPDETSNIALAEHPEQLTDKQLRDLLKIQVVDVSEGVQDVAVERAQQYIDQKTHDTGFKGVLKRIWHGNLARDYIRQREIARNRNEIIQEKSLFIGDEAGSEKHQAATTAVVDRFTSEYGLLHKGETNQSLESIDGGELLGSELRALIAEFAKGEMTPDALQEEKTRLLDTFGVGISKEDRDKGLIYADNILKVAINAKYAFEHGVALETIDEALQINLGEARIGARTELRRDAADRVLEKLQSTRIGSAISETTLSAAVGIATSIVKTSARKTAMAAAATIGMGVGAGVMGGLRERLRVKQERQQHLRDIASGSQIDENIPNKRRSQLEKTRYETVLASQLINRLESGVALLDGDQLDSETLSAIVADIAHAMSRNKMSDELNIDFISFDSKELIESQRFQLDLLLAQAKARLGTVTAGMDAETLKQAGIFSKYINETLDGLSDWTSEILLGDVSEKDLVFRKLRRARAAKMGAISLASGVGVGLLVQEVKAAVSSDLQGVFEQSHSGHERRTLLAGIFRRHQTISSSQTVLLDNAPGTEHFSGNSINDHTILNTPDGYKLEQVNGAYHLLDDKGNMVSDHIGFDANGHLDEQSRLFLEQHGFGLQVARDVMQASHAEVSTVSRTVDEYMQAHQKEFTAVRRQLWYDNDTPGSFDRNELKMLWGGEGGSGIDANGNYVFNVSHMAIDGSFHGDQFANFQQVLNDGNFKVALSLNRGSQNFVQLVNVDANGNAIIAKDSFIGQSLFVNQDGHARYVGAYAEAVQITGQNNNGETTMRMFATVVGENKARNGIDVITNNVIENRERVITSLIPPPEVSTIISETSVFNPVEIPLVVPIYGRRGLEATSEGKTPYVRYEHVRYGPQTPEEIQQLEKEVLPILRENPRARIPVGDAVEWYQRLLTHKTSPEYVTSVYKSIDESVELSSMDESIKAIVAIPVAALAEGDNIFQTLSLYGQQSEDAVSYTQVVLNVNWPANRGTSVEDQNAINKVRSEIDRARAAYPNLKIAAIESQLDPELVKATGGAIGHVVRRMYDTIILASDKAIREGRMQPDQEVVIIRNDADSRGISPIYLNRMVKAVTGDSTDAAVGSLKWGIDQTKSLPGFALTLQVLEGIRSSAKRARDLGIDVGIQTSGANTGVRLSTLAAVGSIGFAPYTGAGSDDLEIGARISAVRRSNSPFHQALYTRNGRLSRMRRRWQRTAPSVDYNLIAGDSNDSTITTASGASIDTDPSRLEAYYRSGKAIAKAWDSFDKDGYSMRDADMPTDKKVENLLNDDDYKEVVTNIEYQINQLIQDWRFDRLHVEMELRRSFPSNKPGESQMYEFDGKKFHFTESGKELLRRRLTRNNRGQFDPLGSRRQRVNYGKGTVRRSFATRRTPRLISAQI